MTNRRKSRLSAPGDKVLGKIKVPITRECVACHFKPVPISDNCPNCGRDPLGREADHYSDNLSPRGRQFPEPDPITDPFE